MINVPDSFHGYSIMDEEGEAVPTHKVGEKIEAFVSLKPLSFSTFKKGKENNLDHSVQSTQVLENDLIKYEFNEKGQMISAFDKELGREVLKSPGNILSLYEDRPNNWDAWDIDFFYRGALQETAKVSSKSKVLIPLDFLLGFCAFSKALSTIFIFSISSVFVFDSSIDFTNSLPFCF